MQNCTNPSAYIITIAKNHSFDLLKKKRPLRIGESEEQKIRDLKEEDGGIETRERYSHVRKAIDGLPEKYRTVIHLRDIDGFEFDEISEMTGFEVPYIRVILSRARQKVKEEVEKMYDYDQTKRTVGEIL